MEGLRIESNTWRLAVAGEGRPSFLKKRSKKLLPVAGSAGAAYFSRLLAAKDKSFLVLFFKKELLSALACLPSAISRSNSPATAFETSA
jgi:hypothetical protein